MRRVPGRSQTARLPAVILPDRAEGALLALIATSPVLAQQEDDLRGLETEVTRMQTPVPRAVMPGGSEWPPDPTRFEALWQARSRGTPVFCQQLPANAQEESFEAFRRGMPMVELRENFVDRYLQR